MKKVLALLALLVIFVGLNAQSKKTALGMSALVPGSGELVLGRTNRGIALMAWDIMSIGTFINTGTRVNNIEKSYKMHANTYAGVPLDRSEDYYNRIQNYLSSEEFNTMQEMQARNYYMIYTYNPEAFAQYVAENTYTGDMQWQWDSMENWYKYRDLRADYRKTKMNYNLLIGVLILNRVVSVIDVAVITPRIGTSVSTLSFQPLNTSGLMMNLNFDF